MVELSECLPLKWALGVLGGVFFLALIVTYVAGIVDIIRHLRAIKRHDKAKRGNRAR